jgi:BirA family biotin operon repressor/biotin-[acetyl-CoA-carboxylase] ligase
MDEAQDLAEQGAPDGSVVLAEEMTSARGRFSRAWITPKGQNVSFSVLLRPTITLLPFINMAATLAVAKTVEQTTGVKSVIKWPNDVRVGGRKISGILIESVTDADKVHCSVVGIGINVNFDPSAHPEISSTATSILRETGKLGDRNQVLKLALEHFDDLYRAILDERNLIDEWVSRLETIGRDVQITWQDDVIRGRAVAVDDTGNLVLTKPNGETFTAVAGEVTLQT